MTGKVSVIIEQDERGNIREAIELYLETLTQEQRTVRLLEGL